VAGDRGVRLASGLVVPVFRYGSDGASLYAGAAGSLRIEETVLVVVFVWSGGGRDVDVGDDGPQADGLPEGGDKAVAEPERAEARGVSGVPLRPGGRYTVALGHRLFPLR